eukprot:gene12288-5871_t
MVTIKFVGALLFICLVLVSANLKPQQVKALENQISVAGNNLAQKHCPMRNFKGELFCPVAAGPNGLSETVGPSSTSQDKKKKKKITVKAPKTTSRNIVEIYELEEGEEEPNFTTLDIETLSLESVQPASSHFLISGTGFDRTTREIKFPVLETNPSVSKTKKVDSSPQLFNGIDNFIHYVFKNPTGQQTWEAGLYAQSKEEVLRLANSFSLANTKVGITQQIYTSFTAKVKSMTPVTDFNSIINSLPPWNPNDPSVKSLYDMLINFYGTDVATTTQLGGTIYQQTTVKECYGGNVQQGMISDIKKTIDNSPNSGSGYAKYRKLGTLNILGGNPELGLNKIKQRISTFDQAPAPVKFTTVPIWTIIQNSQKKNYVKAAVEAYIKKNMPNNSKVISDIKAAKDKSFKGPQRVYTMDYQIAQDWVFVTHWKNCPIAKLKKSQYTPNCAIIGSPFTVKAGQTVSRGVAFQNNQAFIERNSVGQVRIITKEGSKVKHTSGWVKKGCTRVRYGPKVCIKKKGFLWRKKTYCLATDTKLYRYVCMDCVPSIKQGALGKHKLRHTTPECHCAGF